MLGIYVNVERSGVIRRLSNWKTTTPAWVGCKLACFLSNDGDSSCGQMASNASSCAELEVWEMTPLEGSRCRWLVITTKLLMMMTRVRGVMLPLASHWDDAYSNLLHWSTHFTLSCPVTRSNQLKWQIYANVRCSERHLSILTLISRDMASGITYYCFLFAKFQFDMGHAKLMLSM